MRIIHTTDGKNLGLELEVGKLKVGDEIELDDGYRMEIHQIVSTPDQTILVNTNYLIILQ